MQKFSNTPFEGHLEVIATLSGDAINDSLRELRTQDRLTVALRQSLGMGVGIDDLSAATGLTPEEIRRRCDRELNLGEDLATLTGC